jgi:signal transduction histidine kinase
VRYHLLDVEIVIQKGLVYLFTLLITAIPFLLLTTLFQAVFTLKEANVAIFILFIAVLFIFSNIKPLTQQWIERSLFRERYRHYKSIHEFSQSIIRFLHLEDLTEKLFTVLTKTLHPRFISIFLSDRKGFFHLHRTFGHEEGTLDALFPSNHPLLERLNKEKKILTREEMEQLRETAIVRQMKALQSELCLPLIFENRLIGLCILGPKEGGQRYSQSELFMLQTLSANASIAFENARLYGEVTTYIEQFAAISRAINLSPDVDQIFELLLKEIQKYTPFDWGSLAIYKQEGEISFYRVKGRQGTPLPKDYTWPLTDLNVISRLSIQKEPLCQTDLYDPSLPEKEKKLVKKGVRSYVILPLWARGKLIGTLNLWSPYPLERPAQALDLIVPLTHHLAPFLEVARLFEEMKKANEALRQKSLELETSQRDQARFFSFVTHELRTPLNAIVGYLSLILDGSYGSVDAKQAVAIHRAKENSILLKQLINDFLDVARLETEKVSIRLEEIELGSFLGELLENMESLLMQRGIRVRLNIEDPVFLYTDRLKLRQILQNILSNAIKFTEQGSIRIAIRLIPETEAVMVEISDSGKGISKEDLPHIFEPFWQSQSEPTDIVKGSGLGLTIVKKTVDLLKGEINVSSLVGFGTTFTLIFPKRFPQERRKIA